MWQGKSLIPKPRLNTPRRTDIAPNPLFSSTSRTPSRTPTRIPRPPSRLAEETTANQTATTKYVDITAAATHLSNQTNQYNTRIPQPSTRLGRQTNEISQKRGDMLAEHVIASGIISPNAERLSTPNYGSTSASHRCNSIRPSQRCNDEPRLAEYGISNQSSQAGPDLALSDTYPKTPPRKLKSSHVPRTDLCNPSSGLSTPERRNTCGETGQTGSNEELVIDEELVTRTPAKHKNSEWLASFGIDISLLKVTDDADEENCHPNVTPSRDLGSKDREVIESSRKNKPTTFRAFQRRSATDFHGYAQTTCESPAGPPTRVASVRKTRRASARVSVRELDALKHHDEVEVHAKKVNNDIPKGSDVFLTPIRATRKQRETNGTPVVLSEVRRSLRINTPSTSLVPQNSVRGRIELLEANDHSYIPNPNLSDRATLSR